MRTRASSEVRERLRQLLTARARSLGLAPGAVDGLVVAAALERWGAGDTIPTVENGVDRIGLVVVGAAKVHDTRRGRSVAVAFVPPGRLLAVAWSGDPGATAFRVVGHDPLGTIVAFWTPRVLLDVLATMPAAQTLQFAGAAWRTTTEVLRDTSRLLTLCLRDRVLAVLRTLAHDFGLPHPDGLRIELRLTHQDLASAAVASRANVTRALEELRQHGAVAAERHRLIVTHRGLALFDDDDAPNPEPARLAQ